MITSDRTVKLFSKLRNRLINNNKLFVFADKMNDALANAYFMNTGMVIAMYNYIDSVPISKIINDGSCYFRNTFVFPKLIEDEVRFYLISSPEDLIIDVFGAQDVAQHCFSISADEIDVVLVPGIAYTSDLRCRVAEDNVRMYDRIFKKTSASRIGLGLNCQIYKGSGKLDTHFSLDGILTEDGMV